MILYLLHLYCLGSWSWLIIQGFRRLLILYLASWLLFQGVIPLIYSLRRSGFETDSDIYKDTLFLRYMPVYNLLIGPDLFSKNLRLFYIYLHSSVLLFPSLFSTYSYLLAIFSLPCLLTRPPRPAPIAWLLIQGLTTWNTVRTVGLPSSLQLLGCVEFAIDHILIFGMPDTC